MTSGGLAKTIDTVMLRGGARRARRSRALAMGFALTIHGLIFLALIAGASGSQLPFGTGSNLGAKNVTVVSLEGLDGSALPFARGRKSTEQKQDDRMDDLFRKLTSNDPQPQTAAVKPPGNSNLRDLFGPQPQDPQKPDPKDKQADRGDGGRGANHGDAKGSETRPEAVKTADTGGGDGQPAAGSFPGMVERCWRNLPGRSSAPVTLEVTLNEAGLIATPPKILRPAGASLNEGRLISEERAIRALAGCVPYRGALRDGRTFRLNFRAR
jgi:hypothetical protein